MNLAEMGSWKYLLVKKNTFTRITVAFFRMLL